MRTLVTGGTGHLGRAVVALLQDEGHRVRLLARRPRTSTGLLLPTDVRMQAVDSDVFAEVVVACFSDGRRGEREDFVGPEALTMRELAEQYLAALPLSRAA
jgi:uncharacterized protein YbjT (DUF2867 family)